ncbi:hypothetical protein ANN_19870 [Periplaneta americana]|uniref:Uncharacterized protein n=1 Tax=Periplaneta americana TaxID=6978 RepID=A0ABQ8SBG5_PERAM|nr:hypothetical protein ANN_19870 [Periplaneta americana]
MTTTQIREQRAYYKVAIKSGHIGLRKRSKQEEKLRRKSSKGRRDEEENLTEQYNAKAIKNLFTSAFRKERKGEGGKKVRREAGLREGGGREEKGAQMEAKEIREKYVMGKMNMTKTQVMSNGPESPIIIDGAELQYVSEYVYLGQLVSFHQKTEKEIKRRISLAWKAFWSLKFIVPERTLSKKLRIEILETCVTPVLLYGCQTWSLTAKLRNSLQI